MFSQAPGLGKRMPGDIEDECGAELDALSRLASGEDRAAGDGRSHRIKKAGEALAHALQRADEMTRGYDGIEGARAKRQMRNGIVCFLKALQAEAVRTGSWAAVR